MHVLHNHIRQRPRLKVLLRARTVSLKCRSCRLNGNVAAATTTTTDCTSPCSYSIILYSRVDIVEEVDETLDQIKDKSRFIRIVIQPIISLCAQRLCLLVTRLEGMHRKHLLPGFDDRSSDEAAIEKLTSDITNVCG